MLFVCHLKNLHKHCLQFLLGVKMAPRETENNVCAKCWGDKQRALWYVLVFSGVVNLQSIFFTAADMQIRLNSDWTIDYNRMTRKRIYLKKLDAAKALQV